MNNKKKITGRCLLVSLTALLSVESVLAAPSLGLGLSSFGDLMVGLALVLAIFSGIFIYLELRLFARVKRKVVD